MIRRPFRLVMLAISLASPLARADTVFNCKGPDGHEVLQNAPCQDAALLWLKNGRPGAAPAHLPTAALPREPSLGMTTAEVRALLGAPTEVTQEEVVDGRTLVWTYDGARSYQFDSAGILVSK